MASNNLVIGAVRRDADTTAAADGEYHPLYTNATGRVKTSNTPAAYDDATGNITAASQTVAVDTSRASNVMVYVTGTFTGVNLTFEISGDGTNWVGTQVVRSNANTVESTSGVIATGVAYAWEASVNAAAQFRVRSTAWASGTAAIRIVRGSYATEPIPAMQSHPVTFASAQAVTLASTTLSAVTPGTAATSLGKAEDAVAASGDVGVFALSVRNDNAAAVPASATADYQQISTNTVGGVFVQDTPTTTPTISRVATSTTSATLAALSAARRALLIYNESAGVLYVKFGATASATSYSVAVPASQYYEVPAFYTGIVDGILDTGTGNAQVTSLV